MSELSIDSLLDSLTPVEEETTIEKAASESETSVADELKSVLTKEASDQGESEMNLTGKELAESILAMVKQANNVADETAAMVADDDKKEELNQVQGKTVTEAAKASVERGGDADTDEVKEDNVGAPGAAVASDISKQASELIAEGKTLEEAAAIMKQASEKEAELEKLAAVNELMAEGIDFEDAVLLVKQASEASYSELEKAAAVSELVEQDGIAFDDAVALVKEAASLGK